MIKKVTEIRVTEIRVIKIKATEIRATEIKISSNHRELHGAYISGLLPAFMSQFLPQMGNSPISLVQQNHIKLDGSRVIQSSVLFSQHSKKSNFGCNHGNTSIRCQQESAITKIRTKILRENTQIKSMLSC